MRKSGLRKGKLSTTRRGIRSATVAGSDQVALSNNVILKGFKEVLLQGNALIADPSRKIEAVLFQNIEMRLLGNVLIVQGKHGSL